MLDTKVTLVCTKCGEEKSTEEFYKDKHTKLGFRYHCKACDKIHYQNTKEEIAANKKIHYQNNKEEIAANKKIHYQNNKEEIAARHKIYHRNNKEKMAEASKNWRINNPHKKRTNESRRRASKIQASPTWTSQLQKLQIESLAKEAVNIERSKGVKFHLDHIHPLNNKYICGLHLPCNLQLLSESENCSKSNKFQPYVESELDSENLKPWECFYPVLYIDISESA